MSRVIIGPYKAGLDLRNVFDDHKKSGLPSPKAQFDWPEAKRPWPRGAVIVQATENEMKVVDNQLPLHGYDVTIVPKSLLFSSEDSMETEDNSIDIARNKVQISLENQWNELTESEQQEALRAIGVDDLRKVLWMAEDREMKMDPKLRNHNIWAPYRSLPLVREAFNEGHIYPGKRLNELMNAVGGAINLLDMFAKAAGDLKRKGVSIEQQHTSYITYHLKPAMPGLFPFPDEGIYIVASEKGRTFRAVNDNDRALEKAGNQFELDHFDVPEGYMEYVDRHNVPVFTIENLRGDRQRQDYFKNGFVAARAMRALIHCANIPKADSPKNHVPSNRPQARIISNLNIGEWAHDLSGQSVADYERSAYRSRINSHADLERAFYHAEGVIVEPYPDVPLESQRPAGMSAARYNTLYNLIRRLECQMFMENRLALKPLAEPTAYGRPLMIHQDIKQKNMPWYFDAAKFRTVTSRSEFIFGSYSDEEDLAEKLAQGWEDQKFTPNPASAPDYQLAGRQELLKAIGRESLGFSYASFGSASSHIPSGNNDCYVFSSLAAKNALPVLHGGGGRYIMEKKYSAPIHLWHEGHRNFINIGVRVPVASRKEGSHASLLAKYEMELDPGCKLSDRHYSFGNGCFHVFTTNYIGERQHMIMGPAQAGVFFVGGTGTKYEFTPMALHNAYIELRGYGIFPGFENTAKKRIMMINSEVENGLGCHGYFDNWLSMWSDEEKEIIDMHAFAGPEQGFEALMAYRKSGLWQPKTSAPGVDQGPQMSRE